MRQLHPAKAAIGAAALLALAAPAADAVHWPFFGGDAGRSGYQPVDQGGVPVTFAYRQVDATGVFVKTSIVTTTGAPNTTVATAQKFAYGTTDGKLHLRLLATGAEVGAAGGLDLDEGTDDANLFGDPGNLFTGVTPADTSSAAGLGNLYAVHNDSGALIADPDIEVAVVKESDGVRLAADVDVAGSAGFLINSSPVIATDAAGVRALFFTALDSVDGIGALFRVPIKADGTVDGPAATNTANALDANELASPTFLSRSATVKGLLVATDNGTVSYRSAADLSQIDVTAVLVSGTTEVQTPATLVGPDGLPPVTPDAAGAVYAAVDLGSTTRLYKFDAQTLDTEAMTPDLAGTPSNGLAVNQAAGAVAPAKIAVSTGQNLYLFANDTLAAAGKFSATDALVEGTTGFSQTTPVISGAFIYAVNDQGLQFVLNVSDAQPVAPAAFTRNAENTAATSSSFGQPSLSRGFVQYAAGNEVFVYRNVDLTDPAAFIQSPAADGSVLSGAASVVTVRAGDARGIARVGLKVNGSEVASSTTATRGASFAAPSNATTGGAEYDIALDTTKLINGTYRLTATVIDNGGRTRTTAERSITISNARVFVAGVCTNLFTGTAGDDFGFDGSAFGDRINLLAGDDTSNAGAGDDCVDGGDGDDTLRGGAGTDKLTAGSGDDTLFGDAGKDTLSGGSGSDALSGGSGNDTISGSSGSDSLSGSSGTDRLSGGSGSDTLSGGSGNDRLTGGSGDDTLTGGSGVNRLDGGNGDDVINARNRKKDSITCGKGRDEVTADRKDKVSRNCEVVRRR